MGARNWRVLSAVTAAVMLGICSRATAGIVAFTVDPLASYLTLTGTYNTDGGLYTLQETVANSLTTKLAGTIFMEVGTTPYGFRGGNVSALNNGTYLPGLLPGNFGFQTSLPPPERIILGCVRDFAFSIEGEPRQLSGNNFDMNTTAIQAMAGQIDADFAPSIFLAGQAATGVSGTGTVGFSGLNRTIQIPFTMTFEVAVPENDLLMNLAFSGLIVSKGTVPEPATAFMVLSGAALMVRRAARRR
jgi:hypothetical protein